LDRTTIYYSSHRNNRKNNKYNILIIVSVFLDILFPALRNIIVPVTRRKVCNRQKEYIYSWSGSLAESIYPCPSVRMNAEISETVRARLLGFGRRFLELAQRKFFSAGCHAHSNAHKLQKIINISDISETIKDRELGFHV